MNRRSFFKTSLTKIITAGTLLKSGTLFSGTPPPLQRTLGRTGLQLPVISMGTMNTNDPSLIVKAYERGIRLFDTAGIYSRGNNERLLGKTFSENKLRNNVLIQTKIFHPFGRGFGRTLKDLSSRETEHAFLKKFYRALKRLKTDYIDILLYHSVDDEFRLNDPAVRKAMLKIKEEGTARFLGISTHGKMIRQAVDAEIYDVILTHLNFTMDDDTSLTNAVEYAYNKNIGIMAMKVHGGNRLAHGIMNHKAALRWVIHFLAVATVISGMANDKQLYENFSVVEYPEYSDEDIQFLNTKNIKMDLGFCRQCGTCIYRCPHNLDIPGLMRVHMYAEGYRNPDFAGEFLKTMCRYDLSTCSGCRSCTAECSHSVTIQKNISELRSRYSYLFQCT